MAAENGELSFLKACLWQMIEEGAKPPNFANLQQKLADQYSNAGSLYNKWHALVKKVQAEQPEGTVVPKSPRKRKEPGEPKSPRKKKEPGSPKAPKSPRKKAAGKAEQVEVDQNMDHDLDGTKQEQSEETEYVQYSD